MSNRAIAIALVILVVVAGAAVAIASTSGGGSDESTMPAAGTHVMPNGEVMEEEMMP